MALQIPNLGKIQKVDPKLGEALQKVQTYVTFNSSPTPGNRTPRPPFNATRNTG